MQDEKTSLVPRSLEGRGMEYGEDRLKKDPPCATFHKFTIVNFACRVNQVTSWFNCAYKRLLWLKMIHNSQVRWVQRKILQRYQCVIKIKFALDKEINVLYYSIEGFFGRV